MDRALVKGSISKVPPGLASLFNDPPLVGDEKLEDYESLFSAIVAAIKPSDTVVWLLARDFTDLSWEIRRERRLKLQVIKLAESDVVSRILSTSGPSPLGLPHMAPGSGQMDKVAKQWANDPEARQSIDNKLSKKGYDASYVSTQAMKRAGPHIEAIDRRIATYEVRRMNALRGIEQYSEASAPAACRFH
jgi:hypothetical protein